MKYELGLWETDDSSANTHIMINPYRYWYHVYIAWSNYVRNEGGQREPTDGISPTKFLVPYEFLENEETDDCR